ncbi:Hypothetical predicted protein [Olea europaea subsp. europaea]|uniref:Uncharacterized protein n=1 Tax=Olea europaea subsp. europaea TaxID=158383 RepID=A0A8S0V6A1_OLEEU|nr:Hypothetical predicted protein [Olea europaea subsp. europaea]
MGDSGSYEGTDSRNREAFAALYKEGIGGNSLCSQHEGRSLGEPKKVEKNEFATSMKISGSSASIVEDSGSPRMMFQIQVSAPQQIKKASVRRDESTSEQVQKARESKGNQEHNVGLKMKANEFEKLLAKHKLQVFGDQSNSSGRDRLYDIQHELAASLSYRKPVSDITSPQLFDSYTLTESVASSKTLMKLKDAHLTKKVGSQKDDDVLNKSFAELSVSKGSRGKFYVSYMQKRDAKLRKEWSSNRADKEARLKAMQDRLEWSRAEMKIKFSGSADGDNSVFRAHRLAERLRSFNSRSIMKSEQVDL